MKWNQLYEEKMMELAHTSREFPWENAAAYANWLGQTYHFVLNSTRILALASARTPMDQYQLHNRFIDHAKEERGHEALLLRDLKALGKTIDAIPEYAPTAALYKTQYFWIEHRAIEGFMGWVLALEAFASKSGPGILKRVTEAHGREASLFWKVHAEEDQDHIEKALKQVAQLPEKNQEDTILNFIHCVEFYKTMLEQCAAKAMKSSKAA